MDKRNSHISTFSGGMDRDTNFANMPKEKYYELKNGRVAVNNYSNSLAVTPFKQPSKYIYLSDETGGSVNDIIIGSILIRDGELFKLVVFTTQSALNNKDKIWLINLSTNAVVKKYEGDLNFNKDNLVDGISKYESSSNIKIYWWDNLNPFRYCNIAENISAFTSQQFETVPDCKLEQPKFTSVSNSGEYRSGKVQYCYRLYKLGGASTNISSFSGMVHLTGPNIDEQSPQSYNYLGSPKQTAPANTGKAVSMYINKLSLPENSLFDRIIVYSIYYETANQSPVVKKIFDTSYSQLSDEFSFIDTGNVSGSIVIDINDILFENFLPYPKTGVTKHNSLYLGNIQKDNFILSDEIYNGLRAFRFAQSTNNMYLDDKILSITNPDDFDTIGTTNNCILEKAQQRDKYKYQRNSWRLGGTGKYISYEFFIKQVVIDDTTDTSVLPHVPFDTVATSMAQLNLQQESDNYPLDFSYTDYNSPAINYMGAGYMRDEVYPFAIVFRNNKAQKSFPIWIADIKMPIMQDLDSEPTYTISGVERFDFNIIAKERGDNPKLYANILGVKFNIDYASLKLLAGFEDIVGWEIVRMPRKPEDRSVVAQGVLAGLHYNIPTNTYYYDQYVATNQEYTPVTSKDINAIFISPDYYLGNVSKPFDIPYKNGDYIWNCFKYIDKTTSSTVGTKVFKYTSIDNLVDYTEIPLTSTTSLPSNSDIAFPNGRLISKAFSPVGSKILRGSSLGITSDNLGLRDANLYGVNYCRNIDDTAYGGNTYASRFNRQYISTVNYSLLNTDNTQSLMVLGGDTYISYFDNLTSMFGYSPVSTIDYTDDYSVRAQSFSYFPLECTSNLNLRHGYFSIKQGQSTPRNLDYWRQALLGTQVPVFLEKAGTYYSKNGTDIAIQQQAEDYYLYNTVYSQYPLYPVYTPLPENFVNTEEFDARVIYSDTKITGESIDSWLIFRPLNFKDLDYEYGPINRLIKFKDNVYCFQSKAFSLLSINPRVALTSDNGLPVQLGTGSKFERFDYLSTKYGSLHRFGSVATDIGLYFIDGLNKKLMIFAGENIPLSDLKGIYSYINKDLQNNELITDLGYSGMSYMQYDPINNDVLFNFINTNSLSYGVSITYNELLKTFVSINSLNSRNTEGPIGNQTIVNRDLRNSFMNITNNGLVVFKDDKIFQYDSQYNVSVTTELLSVINENYTERKVFDNLYFDLDILYPFENRTYNYVQTLSSHQLKECIQSIQFYNDYQNTSNIVPELKTGWQTPSNYNTSKVEREYMFQIPGNDTINPANSILDTENTYKETTSIVTPPTFRDRMRGKYVVCKIKLKPFIENYPSSNSIKVFALNYLKTLYRISY